MDHDQFSLALSPSLSLSFSLYPTLSLSLSLPLSLSFSLSLSLSLSLPLSLSLSLFHSLSFSLSLSLSLSLFLSLSLSLSLTLVPSKLVLIIYHIDAHSQFYGRYRAGGRACANTGCLTNCSKKLYPVNLPSTEKTGIIRSFRCCFSLVFRIRTL
jgi:hypothetical protein